MIFKHQNYETGGSPTKFYWESFQNLSFIEFKIRNKNDDIEMVSSWVDGKMPYIIMYQYLALCIDKIAKYYTPANTIQLAIFTYCNFYADFCNENTGPCKYAQSLALCFKNTFNLSFWRIFHAEKLSEFLYSTISIKRFVRQWDVALSKVTYLSCVNKPSSNLQSCL